MSVLSIHNVSKHYREKSALLNVDLEIPKGSIYGLLGPNGAGKTSLIRIINQITAPDTGYIELESQKLHPNHIKQIGYLPEERGLYRKMKVGEQALYLAQLKGMDKHDAHSKLKEWFTKFDMVPWWNKKVEELSKGMQQKVQFIVTIIHNPTLLIFDEPFTGFDPINTNLIKDELLKLSEEGKTIILSTHRMESVEELCSHIALINNAEKIIDGSVNDIRKSFKGRSYEIDYKGNSIAFANALWTGAKLESNEQVNEHMRAVVELPEGGSTNNLLSQLLPHIEILNFKEKIPSMNEIFISLVEDDLEKEEASE
ncbi:MAG: ABC transporter ATP-binding protein [Bacteroidia bacterium]|nr:ATP-binding cassette domain-containing protein [Bacteroidia bacterium]NNM16629.1 ABC transporter ATP-binding protein [Bacteroidia bacterium]